MIQPKTWTILTKRQEKLGRFSHLKKYVGCKLLIISYLLIALGETPNSLEKALEK